MLSPRDKKLLTAYVDGECSPSEARQAVKLLRHSAAARQLLAGLEEDAQTLRSMASLTVPIDLTAPVLAQAAAPRPARVAPPRDAFPIWRGVAAAAAVLFLVGLGTFLLTCSSDPVPRSARQAAPPPRLQPAPADNHHAARRPAPQPARDLDKAPADEPAPEWPTVPGPEVIDAEDDDPPARPKGTVITSMFDGPAQALERVTLALPTIHKAHRLDHGDDARKLLEQLHTAHGFRLELLCRDGARGLERFRAALAGRKVKETLDPVARELLKKKPAVRSSFAVYLENVSPHELLALLRDAGVADRRVAERKPAEGRFDGALVVKPLGALDRKELVELLGLDPVRQRPAAAARPATVDITKPLSEQTGRQVGDAVRGRSDRPGAERPAPHAIVLPLSGPRVRSAELKLYLETRTPAQPGTLQALIVLRQI